MDEVLSLSWKDHSSTFLNSLRLIRKKQLYTDVTLACSGKFYGAHKMVLTACSDYFKEIFDHTDYNKPVIIIKDLKCENLEALLDYMYVGEVNVRQCDLGSLIKAAECLQVKGLAVADDEHTYQNKTTSRNVSSLPDSKRKRKLSEVSSPDITQASKTFRQNEKALTDNSFDSEKACTKDEPLYKIDSILIKTEMEDSPPGEAAIIEEPAIIEESIESTVGVSPQSQNRNPPKYSRITSYTPQDFASNEQSTTDRNLLFQDMSSDWQGIDSTENYSTGEHGGELSNDRFIKCQYCSKLFNRQSHLLVHIRIHTGEKPYSCPHCPYQANVKGNLRRHLITVHGLDYEAIWQS